MISDTIVAIATPLGGTAGIGVVRISGKDAIKTIKTIFRPTSEGKISSHTIRHGWIVDDLNEVDQVMVSYMAAPKSYTGEDVIEISCHGGGLVLRTVLEMVLRSGARLAERGEFTKRAFLNGKIDLAQAEAVIDLINAKTKQSSMLAASQLKGSLSNKIKEIRPRLIKLVAEIEASIDFPDEITDIDRGKALKEAMASFQAVDNLLKTADLGKIYREGLCMVIIGKPNVGKSSLLNAFLRQERAIVTEEPGTTRDIIEETLNVKGIPIRVVDTAGIRESSDKTEIIGIERAINTIEKSDLILLMMDISSKISSEDIELIIRTNGKRRIFVLNKSDLRHTLESSDIMRYAGEEILAAKVSVLKEEGIVELESKIFDVILSNKALALNTDVMINLRHKQCLIRAKEQLEASIESIEKGMQTDFITIDLKGAIASLGEVTGEVASEEVIDRIFEEFCVGK